MIWALIPAPIKRAVAWLAAAIAGLGLAWMAGKRDARQQTALEAAEAYAKTRKDMDDAPEFGNDPDAARRWLRERDANQP